MRTDKERDEAIEGYLTDELKTVNAHLPRSRKTLAELMDEPYPYVLCNDGSEHHFRKKELRHLAELVSEEEQSLLLLPIILEVQSEQGDIVVHSKQGIEAKVLSAILDMPLVVRNMSLRIYRPQVQVLRSSLKTTTQYVFRI